MIELMQIPKQELTNKKCNKCDKSFKNQDGLAFICRGKGTMVICQKCSGKFGTELSSYTFK